MQNAPNNMPTNIITNNVIYTISSPPAGDLTEETRKQENVNAENVLDFAGLIGFWVTSQPFCASFSDIWLLWYPCLFSDWILTSSFWDYVVLEGSHPCFAYWTSFYCCSCSCSTTFYISVVEENEQNAGVQWSKERWSRLNL